MQNKVNTVVLCLRSGGDFTFRDVELIAYHLQQQHTGALQILCLSDKVDQIFQLKTCTLIPTPNKQWPGWWTKMNLFSPEMEQYRPFLYVDLDTAIVGDITSLFMREEDEILMLEDFYRKENPASGIMWIPSNSEQVRSIWGSWISDIENHMKKYRGDQNFISNFTPSKKYWQTVTNRICSFKVRKQDRSWLQEIPKEVSVVCFHGYPRIGEAVAVPWVREYVQLKVVNKPKVTVIIPYKVDRGWLQEAIDSVPDWVQLLVSQGEGDWAENFNKALPQATGDYIKFLHEDDMLTENCIEDSVKAIEEQGVDFIHGKAYSITPTGKILSVYTPPEIVTYTDLLEINSIHGGTLMFHRRVFDKLGGYKENLHHSEEYEFNLRAMQAGFKLGYCDKILYFYRRHDGQKSFKYGVNLNHMGQELAKQHKKEFEV